MKSLMEVKDSYNSMSDMNKNWCTLFMVFIVTYYLEFAMQQLRTQEPNFY
jgi:hypothetical protein